MRPKQTDGSVSIARWAPVRACALATGVMALGVVGCASQSTAPSKPPLSLVKVVAARTMTLPLVVKPIGTTRALNDVTIRARVKGFLQEKHFDEGRNVKKDQLLLVIEKRPYEVQLESARAQLAAAKAGLEKATASKRVPVSKAKLALDDAQLSLDMIEERRARNLLARNAASQEDFDRAEAQRKKSAAQVESDRASVAEAEADYTIDIDNAKAEVARAESAVENAEIELGYCSMYSPIDGRIGELKVKLGNLVGDNGDTELVTIQQLDPMGLDLRPAARNLPIATALQAKGGIAVSLVVEGERPHPHMGKTIFVDNSVDPQTSTFLVRAEVPNPEGAILPGQYIKASVTIGEYKDAVVVPEQAVLEGQEGARVYVVDGQNKVQTKKVVPIDDFEGLRVLESGVNVGDKVIVEGIQLVRPGQEVAVEEAPFDQFRHAAPKTFNADPRLSSKVSRLPSELEGQEGASGSEKKPDAAPKKDSPESPRATPKGAAAPEKGTTSPSAKDSR
jgi:multidrug efflux pump subunit AcrA (membrane-fusion protein)